MKWLLVVLATLLLVLGVMLVLVQRWIGTDDLRARIEREAGEALGVPVQLGRLDVTLWPLPAISLQTVRVTTRPALDIGRVDVRPDWLSLARREPAVSALVLRDMTLPQAGLDALMAAVNAKNAKNAKDAKTPSGEPAPPAGLPIPGWLPRKTLVRGLTWISAKGISSTLDGEAELGADGLPGTIDIKVLRGRLQDTRLQLQRSASEADGWPAWELNVRIAGGNVKGRLSAMMPGFGTAPVAARPKAAGSQPVPAWALSGQLETRELEVSALTAPSRTLSGRLEASTRLHSRAGSPGALVTALETQTSFTVRQAVLHGLDLAQAVKTVGMNRGGQTALDTLAGQVRTQGQRIQLSNLVASSGVLSATGHVNISPARALDGRVSVDMAPGVVGVPLLVGGTLEAPSVTLTRGALIGAAIGTAIMPGVGTGAGAKLGDRLGEGFKGLFGSDRK